MNLRSAHAYINTQTDEVVPYYVAIPLSVYQALPALHPYKIYGSNTSPGGQLEYEYKHLPIPSIGGPFADATGNLLQAGSSGYLIEKQMNQFKYLSDGQLLGSPDQGIMCNQAEGDISAMMMYFNGNISQLQVPFSPGPFGIVPTQLECNGGSVNNENNADDIYEILNDVWTCQFSGIDALIECMDEHINEQISFVNGIVIEQFNENGQSYTFDFNNRNEDYTSASNLPSGLYKCVAVGNNGAVYPFFYEHINENYKPQEKDYVIMTLLPTLIENDQLNLSISSEIGIMATVQVQSLDGTIHYTEVVNLKSTIDRPLNITINTSNIPYNQLKVNLIFSDGSIIQQTAVKVN